MPICRFQSLDISYVRFHIFRWIFLPRWEASLPGWFIKRRECGESFDPSHRWHPFRKTLWTGARWNRIIYRHDICWLTELWRSGTACPAAFIAHRFRWADECLVSWRVWGNPTSIRRIESRVWSILWFTAAYRLIKVCSPSNLEHSPTRPRLVFCTNSSMSWKGSLIRTYCRDGRRRQISWNGSWTASPPHRERWNRPCFRGIREATHVISIGCGGKIL